MQRKTLYLTLFAAMTLVNPCGNDAHSQQNPLEKATKKVKREYRNVPEGQGALTKQMIENCIRLKSDVDSTYADIGKAQEDVDRLNSELSNLKSYLDNLKSSIDGGDQSARAEYDGKVQEYNAKLKALKAGVDEYRVKNDKYNSSETKFERECNGQPYYQDDYNEIVKKMGRGF